MIMNNLEEKYFSLWYAYRNLHKEQITNIMINI